MQKHQIFNSKLKYLKKGLIENMVTNKVKCEICGMMYDEPRAIDYFILENKSKCPKCIGINDLKSLVSEYNRKHN